MIEVIDRMGDRWWLSLQLQYEVSEKGLVEVLALQYGRPHIPGFACITLPVFTEWWP